MKHYYLFILLSLITWQLQAQSEDYTKVVIKGLKGRNFKMEIDKKTIYPRNAKRLVLMMKTNKGYPVCFRLDDNPKKAVAGRYLVLAPNRQKAVYKLRQNRRGQYYLQSPSGSLAAAKTWLDKGKDAANNYTGKGSDWVQKVAGVSLPKEKQVYMNGADYKLVAVRNAK